MEEHIEHTDETEEEEEEGEFPVSELDFHTDSVMSVSIHPQDPECFATGGVDDKAFLIKGEDAHEFADNQDSISIVRFSSEGKFLALACMDGSVSVYNLECPENLPKKLEGPQDEILSMEWHRKGPVLVVGCADLSIWVWHVEKQDPLGVIYGHPINLVKFSPNGRFLYSAGKDASLKVWDLKNPDFASAPPASTIQGNTFHSSEIVSADMHSDNNLILTGDCEGIICITNRSRNSVLHKISCFEESAEDLAFCQEMNWIAVGSLTGEVKVYEVETMQMRWGISLGGGVVKLVWSGLDLFVGGIGGVLESFDARNGYLKNKYLGHEDTILDFDIKHGKMISGSDDKKVLIHSVS